MGIEKVVEENWALLALYGSAGLIMTSCFLYGVFSKRNEGENSGSNLYQENEIERNY